LRIVSVTSIVLGAIGLTLWPFGVLVFPIAFPIAGACLAGISITKRKRGDPLPVIGLIICVLAIVACAVTIALAYWIPCTGRACGLN
jgi:hypothetical protein